MVGKMNCRMMKSQVCRKSVAVFSILGLTATLWAGTLSGEKGSDSGYRMRVRERVRLQNQEMEIDKMVSRAFKFRQTGEYDKAVNEYLEAKKALEKFYAVHKLERIRTKITACTEAVAKVYFSFFQGCKIGYFMIL